MYHDSNYTIIEENYHSKQGDGSEDPFLPIIDPDGARARDIDPEI